MSRREPVIVPAVQVGRVFSAALQDVAQTARAQLLRRGESLTVDLEVFMDDLRLEEDKAGILRLFKRKATTKTSSLSVRLATRIVITPSG